MSINQLSAKARETLGRIAKANGISKAEALRQMEASVNSKMATRHQLNLKLA